MQQEREQESITAKTVQKMAVESQQQKPQGRQIDVTVVIENLQKTIGEMAKDNAILQAVVDAQENELQQQKKVIDSIVPEEKQGAKKSS